jgi:hypothetical protein
LKKYAPYGGDRLVGAQQVRSTGEVRRWSGNAVLEEGDEQTAYLRGGLLGQGMAGLRDHEVRDAGEF